MKRILIILLSLLILFISYHFLVNFRLPHKASSTVHPKTIQVNSLAAKPIAMTHSVTQTAVKSIHPSLVVPTAPEITFTSADVFSSKWQITNSAGTTLEGYTQSPSYEPGQTIAFFIHNIQPFHMTFYKMGYDKGLGGLNLGTSNELKGVSSNKEPTKYVRQAGWKPTVDFIIPKTWKSGAYLVKLTDSQNRQSYIPFVIHEKEPKAQVGILISTNTYQAYNSWGGKSLYGFNSTKKIRSTEISYLRPYKREDGAGNFFEYEYSFIRWVDRQNYTVTYFTDKDVNNGILKNASIKALVIPGHDEYWTMSMRKNIDYFSQTQKKGLALLNANTGFWQCRYKGSNIIAYKSTPSAPVYDPIIKTDISLVTTQFRNAPVNMPENQLFGIMYNGIPVVRYHSLHIISNHWLLKGTSLKVGSVIPMIVGGEVDGISTIKATPPPNNLQIIGQATMAMKGKTRQGTSDLVWYKNPEGGNVFSVGTFYWNWELDPYNAFGKSAGFQANRNVQTITRNALNALIQ